MVLRGAEGKTGQMVGQHFGLYHICLVETNSAIGIAKGCLPEIFAPHVPVLQILPSPFIFSMCLPFGLAGLFWRGWGCAPDCICLPMWYRRWLHRGGGDFAGRWGHWGLLPHGHHGSSGHPKRAVLLTGQVCGRALRALHRHAGHYVLHSAYRFKLRSPFRAEIRGHRDQAAHRKGGYRGSQDCRSPVEQLAGCISVRIDLCGPLLDGHSGPLKGCAGGQRGHIGQGKDGDHKQEAHAGSPTDARKVKGCRVLLAQHTPGCNYTGNSVHP